MTKTAQFLSVLNQDARAQILRSIATHYGISEQEAYAEVTDDAAEHLLDYMTGSARAATSVLMQKYGYR